MVRRLVTVAALLLFTAACAWPPGSSTAGECSAGVPLGAGEEADANFHLYVSNQSFEIDPVYVEVVIDGERVVCREFLVEGQHNWILFDLNLGSGDHSIAATAHDGLATLTEEFATSDQHWAVLDFWSEGGGEFFTFDVLTVRSGSPTGVSEASYLPTTCRASPSVPPTPCGRNTTNGYAKSSAR
jgi:hypothetical protein